MAKNQRFSAAQMSNAGINGNHQIKLPAKGDGVGEVTQIGKAHI